MIKRVSREASDATKFKQSLAKQGTNNPNYGKKRDDSTKQKISDALKNIGYQFQSQIVCSNKRV